MAKKQEPCEKWQEESRRRKGNRLLCPEEQSEDHLIGAGLHPQLLSADEKRVLPPG